jgi:hypothetical protein
MEELKKMKKTEAGASGIPRVERARCFERA